MSFEGGKEVRKTHVLPTRNRPKLSRMHTIGDLALVVVGSWRLVEGRDVNKTPRLSSASDSNCTEVSLPMVNKYPAAPPQLKKQDQFAYALVLH